MSDHILDTNILIRYLRKMPGYNDLLRETSRLGWVCISAMTRVEIIRGMLDHERKEYIRFVGFLRNVAHHQQSRGFCRRNGSFLA